MHRILRQLYILSAVVLLGCAAPGVKPETGFITVPRLFSDNMVLQQGTDVPIWGWGPDGDRITVTFRNQKVRTRVKNGRWMVKLHDLQPGGPDVMIVEGATASCRFTNVYVGDVWVASGQSNMEFPLKRSFESEPDIAASANPLIHLLKVPKTRLESPTNNIPSPWMECNSN